MIWKYILSLCALLLNMMTSISTHFKIVSLRENFRRFKLDKINIIYITKQGFVIFLACIVKKKK